MPVLIEVNLFGSHRPRASLALQRSRCPSMPPSCPCDEEGRVSSVGVWTVGAELPPPLLYLYFSL
jgi:hypothetical protein